MELLPLFILFVGVIGSFFFAGVETGYISWNPIKVRFRSQNDSWPYRFSSVLLKERELVLGTVLIGNNISIVAASLAFESVWENLNGVLSNSLIFIPSPDLLILTPFLVIFSEMLPKSLFRIYSFRLTYRAIPILTFLLYLFYPLTYLLSLLSSVVGRGKLQKINDEKRKEVALLAKEANRQGTLALSSKMFVENILELNSITVSDRSFISKSRTVDTVKEGAKKLSKELSLLEFISNGLGLKADYYQVGNNIISSFRIHTFLFSGTN